MVKGRFSPCRSFIFNSCDIPYIYSLTFDGLRSAGKPRLPFKADVVIQFGKDLIFLSDVESGKDYFQADVQSHSLARTPSLADVQSHSLARTSLPS